MTKTCQFFFKEMNYLALKLKQVKESQNTRAEQALSGNRPPESSVIGFPLKPIPPYVRYYREIKDELKSKHPGLNNV